MLPSNFRPLLSGKIHPKRIEEDLAKVIFPVIASPKLDGIRTLMHPELGAVTRKLKAIPNKATREALNACEALKGLDGELCFGPPTEVQDPNLMQKSTSAIMSFAGEPELTYYLFDVFWPIDVATAYRSRLAHLHMMDLPEKIGNIHIKRIGADWLNSTDEVLMYEELKLELGYEGIMLRKPDMPYKYNRSALTKTQQHLIKLKRFEDAEGEICEVHELMHNENEQKRDAFGLAERSSEKDGKVKSNMLGALSVRVLNGPFKDQTVKLGTGFTESQRKDYWLARENLPGQVVKFKYQNNGTLNKPRFPVFEGFRKD